MEEWPLGCWVLDWPARKWRGRMINQGRAGRLTAPHSCAGSPYKNRFVSIGRETLTEARYVALPRNGPKGTSVAVCMAAGASGTRALVAKEIVHCRNPADPARRTAGPFVSESK